MSSNEFIPSITQATAGPPSGTALPMAIRKPPPDFRITSGGLDVLVSGTVNTFDPSGVQFQFGGLAFVMKFGTSASGGSPSMQITQPVPSTLEINLTNFDGAIGTGTTAPIEVGTYVGHRLFLSFVITALGPAATKTVHFTFYLGPKV